MITIIIPGPPLSWKAPLKGAHGFYSPRHEVNKIIEAEARKHNGEILTCSVEVNITFYQAIPKATSKKKRALMFKGLIRPNSGGDRTNLAKNYEDRLQGIVYKNDKQIVQGFINKWYDDEPRTIIDITPICQCG